MAWHLKPYFLAHPIYVQTNQHIHPVLIWPKASRRLTKWVIELGEYDNTYEPRAAIKVQGLVDFLAEFTIGVSKDAEGLPKSHPIWLLYVDDSSNNKRSRAELWEPIEMNAPILYTSTF